MVPEIYRFCPQKAQAFGYPDKDGFVVKKGSTTMLQGSPNVKRDRPLRDALMFKKILVLSPDPDLLVFTQDYIFTSPSAAGGIIKDGNCSGPSIWRRVADGKSLKEVLQKP